MNPVGHKIAVNGQVSTVIRAFGNDDSRPRWIDYRVDETGWVGTMTFEEFDAARQAVSA